MNNNINNLSQLISHIDSCIEKGLKFNSNLDPEILKIKGFGTPTMRHFFNNLCSLPNATYLEVGAFHGATFCSAINNNKNLKSIVIDNFSEDFGDSNVFQSLKHNIQKFKTDDNNLRIINADSFNVSNYDLNEKISIYYYDGDHSEDCQAKALPHFFDSMDDVFIHLIDDYNWTKVRKGTQRAFETLKDKMKIVKEWTFETEPDDPVWHNGFYIALIEKTN